MIYATFPFVKSPISQILSDSVIASFDVFYRDVAILMGSLRKPALGGREDSTFLIPCECLKFNHEDFIRLFEAGAIITITSTITKGAPVIVPKASEKQSHLSGELRPDNDDEHEHD